MRLVTTTRTCAGVHQAWSPGRRARRQSQVRTGCREEGFALLSCRCRSALPSVYACLEPVINLSLAAATNQGKWRRPGCRKTAGAVNLIHWVARLVDSGAGDCWIGRGSNPLALGLRSAGELAFFPGPRFAANGVGLPAEWHTGAPMYL